MEYTERFDDEQQRRYWVDSKGRSSWSDPYAPKHAPPLRPGMQHQAPVPSTLSPMSPVSPASHVSTTMSPMYVESAPVRTNRMQDNKRASCSFLLGVVLSLLSLTLGLYLGTSTPVGEQFTQALDLSPANRDEGGGCPSPAPAPATSEWDDSWFSEASFGAIPKETPPSNVFALSNIPSALGYKGATLRDLAYQALYDAFEELPTSLTCTPVFASFYSTPGVPDYCWFSHEKFPGAKRDVLLTLNPEGTGSAPIELTSFPGESTVAAILKSDLPLTTKIVYPFSGGGFYAVDTMKGEVLAGFNNDTAAEVFLNPSWKEGHPAADFLRDNVPRAGLITTNGMVGLSNTPSASLTEEALHEWDSIAMPHFTVAMQAGLCVVEGLRNPLLVSHDGPLGSVSVGGGSVSSDVFPELNAWKKVQLDASLDTHRIGPDGSSIYAIPFDNSLGVECDSFQEEVESALAAWVGQNGKSPFQDSSSFGYSDLKHFKVRSDASDSTRKVYLGLRMHSHLDPSGDLSPPALVGSLSSVPNTASAIREHVTNGEPELNGAFDRCFGRMCSGGSCHDYAKFSKESVLQRSDGRDLETALDICTRCAVLNLDGIPKSTIPWVNGAGVLTTATCEDFVVLEAPATRTRARELSEERSSGPFFSQNDYASEDRPIAQWSNPISAFKPEEMPNYRQFDYNSPNDSWGTCSVGCGPVAWAMLFAYMERAWFGQYGFVQPEFGDEFIAPLCNDIHEDTENELYPFMGGADMAWPGACRGTNEYVTSDCTDPKKTADNVYDFIDCNAAGDVVNHRIMQINEHLGVFCLGSGGAAWPWQMDNVADKYASWHAPYHKQELTTIHNTLFWGGGWPLPAWKNKYLRRQINAGKAAVVGYHTGGFGQHYAVAKQYKWKPYDQCFFGLCATRYKYIYYIHNGWGSGGNNWYSMNAWLAGWVDSKDDEDEEAMYFAWLWCCLWDVASDGACSIDCDSYSPP